MVTELIHHSTGKTSSKTQQNSNSAGKPLKGAMKVIKKLKGRIGLGSNNGDAVGHQSTPTQQPPVLQFHTSTRGDNVRISPDHATAHRVDSFCKGIAFSQRSVRPNEKVYLRVAETSTSWNGVLRIGFTSNNPSSLNGVLPKYACPDLTSRPGFWGKALPERYVDVGVLFTFHFTAGGDMMLNVDGHDKGVFLSGIDARTPLWVMVDIYGNTTAVQFVDPRGGLNNMRNSPSRRSTTSLASSGSGTNRSHQVQQVQQLHQQQQMVRPRSEADLLVSMNALNLNHINARLPSLPLPPIPGNTVQPAPMPMTVASPVLQNFPSSPPLRHYRPESFQPLTLHPRTHGVNIRMGSDCRTALRHEAEFCNGYVMTSRPVLPGESWVVQICQTESVYVGGLGFGFTTCNPASLSPADLPDDADQLLDRPEYWVISKDVAQGPILGDEIEFHLGHNGQVTMMRNRGQPALLMHVDISLPLWAIFDVYGSTRAIRLLGTLIPPCADQQQLLPPPPMRTSPLRPQQQQQQQQQPQHVHVHHPPPPPAPSMSSSCSSSSIYQQQLPMAVPLSSGTASSYVETLTHNLNQGASSECTVCYENSVDCVLYSCGHMCLCYGCAITLYRGGRNQGGQGLCPICRAPIRDVIRAYRS